MNAFFIFPCFFILFLLPFTFAGESGKTDGNLIVVSVNFGLESPPPFDRLKSSLVKRGFDWSSIFAYSVAGNRIVFVAENYVQRKIGERRGAVNLYKLLLKLDKKFDYEVENPGFLVILNKDLLSKSEDSP